MIARKQEIRLQLNQLFDALLLGAAFWLSYGIRHNRLVVIDSLPEIPEFKYFLWMLAVIMPFGPFLLELQGYYNYPLEKTVWKSLDQMAKAGVWLGLLLGTAVIFLRLDVPSRSVLIIFGIIAPLVLLLKERLYVWRRIAKLKQGEFGERIIMAGEKDMIRDIMKSFTRTQRLEIQVAEKVDLENHSTEELISAIHRHNVGRVVLAFSKLELDKVQKAIEACEVEGVEAWLSVDFIRTSVARPTYENLGQRSMLVFRATPDLSWSLMVKNAIDRIGAAVGLAILSPLFSPLGWP